MHKYVNKTSEGKENTNKESQKLYFRIFTA